MVLSDSLLCLFHATVESSDDDYLIRIPQNEIETGSVDPDETYRIAIIDKDKSVDRQDREPQPTPSPSEPQPPVEPGEVRYVEIEDIGKQGDGIARVERGYVIIIPEAEIGERVKIEISDVKSNFAVGEIIEETFE